MKKFRYLIHLLHILLFLYYKRLEFILDRLVEDEHGLCWYLREFSYKKYKNPIDGTITLYIPEFESEYLTGMSQYGYWWEMCDKKSRLVAFKKLIDLYKSKIRALIC